MFSSQFGRVARAKPMSHVHVSVPFAHGAASLSTASATTAPFALYRQRRLSSSRASDGSSNGARPATPSSSDPASEANTSATRKTARKNSGRRSREALHASGAKDHGAAGAAAEAGAEAGAAAGAGAGAGAFKGLPAVPPTGHLLPQDITLSSFFSLHRPISLTTPVPQTTSPEHFNALFESKARSKTDASDVIWTLSGAIDALDGATNSNSARGDASDLRWEIIQESSSNASHDNHTRHLDGAPRARSLEEIVGQLRPFRAPPPPVALVEQQSQKPSKRSAAAAATKSEAAASPDTAYEPKQKSFQTTVTVVESTDSSGVKYYTASTSPMVRVRNPYFTPNAAIAEMEEGAHDSLAREIEFGESQPRPSMRRQGFLERMRERQMGFEERAAEQQGEGMLAISVKRQRKLKMKKHKYKKLMKRTRNLRRRLDRN